MKRSVGVHSATDGMPPSHTYKPVHHFVINVQPPRALANSSCRQEHVFRLEEGETWKTEISHARSA